MCVYVCVCYELEDNVESAVVLMVDEEVCQRLFISASSTSKVFNGRGTQTSVGPKQAMAPALTKMSVLMCTF